MSVEAGSLPSVLVFVVLLGWCVTATELAESVVLSGMLADTSASIAVCRRDGRMERCWSRPVSLRRFKGRELSFDKGDTYGGAS